MAEEAVNKMDAEISAKDAKEKKRCFGAVEKSPCSRLSFGFEEVHPEANVWVVGRCGGRAIRKMQRSIAIGVGHDAKPKVDAAGAETVEVAPEAIAIAASQVADHESAVARLGAERTLGCRVVQHGFGGTNIIEVLLLASGSVRDAEGYIANLLH